MRAPLAAGLVLAAAVASAQDHAPRITLPLHATGLVHRESGFGCGEGWMAHEAWSDTALEVTSRRARLVIDADVRDASGGVSLLGDRERYQSVRQHHVHIEWTGRARREAGRLVISLSAILERGDVEGAPGTQIENRTTLHATLACTAEERDVFAITRPAAPDGESPTGRRSIFVCLFEQPAHEGPLPRPVAELFTTPFFLADGAGVTTDVLSRGGAQPPPVAREPGGFPVPPPPAPPPTDAERSPAPPAE